jgi:SAM-dependent methyltransferase
MSPNLPARKQATKGKPVGEEIASTDLFYQMHAGEYFRRTVSLNMEHLYQRFLPLLQPGARILDAGCGSGRDLRVFAQRGFQPVGVDKSTALVEMARAFSGAPTVVGRLEELADENAFDAIWACASLVHVPRNLLAAVVRRFHKALVAGGLMYASVQEGGGDRLLSDGRFFADYQRAKFQRVIEEAEFDIRDSWLSDDVLPGRSTVRWVNVVARSKETEIPQQP